MKKHKIHLLPVPKKIANYYQQPVVFTGNGFMDGYKHLVDIFQNMLTKEKARGPSKTAFKFLQVHSLCPVLLQVQKYLDMDKIQKSAVKSCFLSSAKLGIWTRKNNFVPCPW